MYGTGDYDGHMYHLALLVTTSHYWSNASVNSMAFDLSEASPRARIIVPSKVLTMQLIGYAREHHTVVFT